LSKRNTIFALTKTYKHTKQVQQIIG